MTKPEIIDSKMHGLEGITATFLLADRKTALVETGPKSSVDNVLAGLERAGVETLDWIVVTHIHLDHAGAAGTIAQRYPEAKIAVHPVGAPHLVDPSKLWSSASRIYGDDMKKLWGGIDPLPAERVVEIGDGDTIELGDSLRLKAVETPGHAWHHHAYLEESSGIIFTGDALGVSPRGVTAFRPATPPPEFKLEVALESIERIRTSGAKEVWLTHFGPTGSSVDDACAQATEVLERWAAWVQEGRQRSSDIARVTAYVEEKGKAELERRLNEAEAERMEMTTSYRMNVSGYMRYFDKKEEKEAKKEKA